MAHSGGGGGLPYQARSGVDIPFDLNKIFSLTYEFQPLKEVLEHIFGQLQKHDATITQIDGKLTDRLEK